MSRLTDRLELAKTRVVAGTTIRGQLVVVNQGKPFSVADACGGGPAMVILIGSLARQDPVIPACATVAATDIAHGATKVAVTITTTYSGCSSEAGQPQGQPITTPPCMPPPQVIPPLPAGRYRTQVVWFSPLPEPATVVVTLTN
jgi:hypothetical protein